MLIALIARLQDQVAAAQALLGGVGIGVDTGHPHALPLRVGGDGKAKRTGHAAAAFVLVAAATG